MALWYSTKAKECEVKTVQKSLEDKLCKHCTVYKLTGNPLLTIGNYIDQIAEGGLVTSASVTVVGS